MNTGQIINSPSNREYTTICNKILQSISLSLEEKGLLAYLLSLPSDWVIYVKNLPELTGEGERTIKRVFASLRQKGYIQSTKQVDGAGVFRGWNHIVYSKPFTDSAKSHPRSDDFASPTVRFTEVGETHPIQKTNNTIQRNTEPHTKFTPPTQEQVVEYFKEKGYTTIAAKKAFEYYTVAGWKDSKGKQVKNWKQKMIGVWFKPENEEKTKTTTQTTGSHRLIGANGEYITPQAAKVSPNQK